MIEVYVREIQNGNMIHFLDLQNAFKPLVICWLKKIHHLHTDETEDYISTAKIVLLECAKTYDFSKNVPFESYYKISLYHWYGNHMKRKRPACISLDAYLENQVDLNRCSIEDPIKNPLIEQCFYVLTVQEQEILKRLLNGQLPVDIGIELHLAKKTVLNKKYKIIKRIREYIESKE